MVASLEGEKEPTGSSEALNVSNTSLCVALKSLNWTVTLFVSAASRVNKAGGKGAEKQPIGALFWYPF